MILLPGHKLTPTQERKLRSSVVLVAWGGELDAPLVQAFQRFASSDSHIVFASPNDPDDHFDWLNPERAIESVTQLASEFRKLYPDRAGAISVNEQRLIDNIRRTKEQTTAMLTMVNGEEVLLDDDRLLPFVQHYGLRSAGILSTVPTRPLSQEEVSKFHVALDQFSSGVMLITNQQAPVVLERRTHIRFVFVDPMIAGYVGKNHYENQMERNALLVTSSLATRPMRKSVNAALPPPPAPEEVLEVDN